MDKPSTLIILFGWILVIHFFEHCSRPPQLGSLWIGSFALAIAKSSASICVFLGGDGDEVSNLLTAHHILGFGDFEWIRTDFAVARTVGFFVFVVFCGSLTYGEWKLSWNVSQFLRAPSKDWAPWRRLRRDWEAMVWCSSAVLVVTTKMLLPWLCRCQNLLSWGQSASLFRLAISVSSFWLTWLSRL